MEWTLIGFVITLTILVLLDTMNTQPRSARGWKHDYRFRYCGHPSGLLRGGSNSGRISFLGKPGCEEPASHQEEITGMFKKTTDLKSVVFLLGEGYRRPPRPLGAPVTPAPSPPPAQACVYVNYLKISFGSLKTSESCDILNSLFRTNWHTCI